MVKTISSATFQRYHITVTVKVVGLQSGYFIMVEMSVGDKWAVIECHEFIAGGFNDICQQIEQAHDLVWFKIAMEEKLIVTLL